MKHKYGHFNPEGNEFIITNPETPRAFDNYLWNESIFSNVQQTGVGYCDYQMGGTEAVQLLTGNGRICDFDIFGRDNLMSRLVYIRDNDIGDFWNANWEPVRKKYESYECTHGLGYTCIKSQTNGIASDFRVFVPEGKDPVELWSLVTRNASGGKRRLSIFVYVQFQFRYKWGFDSYGDMLFRSSCLDSGLNAVVASKHPHRKPHHYLTGFLTADMPVTAYDGTRDAFVGLYGTLQQPDAVVAGRCTNTPGSSDATIGALQFDIELEAGGEKEISLILGATDSTNGISLLKDKYFGKFQQYFQQLAAGKKAMSEKITVKTPDEQLDRLLNYWIKQQAAFGAAWCRWGWNGYRDIVQHGYGISSIKAERTAEILCEALRYQYNSGLALRGWNPADEKPYSDSALWLVFTLVAYLKETGDFSLLKKTVPYYDGGSASILEHIEQAMNFLESNKGQHGLCLIKFGDWNDSLTAVGKGGKGESVWLSEAYGEACRLLMEMFDYQGVMYKSADYKMRYQKIRDAINKNAWDGDWYVRCFDDDGRAVGSNLRQQGKIFIEAQAWALIAGIADKKRAESLINACDDMLATDVGYRLLYPTFTEPDDGIGRISCLEPGICENGTVYSHCNSWMILGLLKEKRAEKAYELLKRITPGYMDEVDGHKHKNPPYVYANCYFGPDHRNKAYQMEFTWITGSVAWYHNLLLNDFLGIKPDYRGLKIDPCIPREWKEYSVSRHFRNSEYIISVRNPEALEHGNVEITADGEKLSGSIIPVYDDGGRHFIDVLIKGR
jgi:cellobiose phosphorylase